MTATEELRRLLSERGADYRVSATGYSIEICPYTTAYANRSDTTLDVSLRQVTPEQAIKAALGRGTCKPVDGYDDDGEEIGEVCSECGEPWPYFTARYCPNCGRRVEQ